MHKRSKSDFIWLDIKNKCRARDKFCRCCSILLPSEVETRKSLSNFNNIMTMSLDVAHCKPVSTNPEIMYDINNVYLLCRWCHTNIDNFRSPASLKNLSENEHWYWWYRIKHKSTEKYNDNKNYENLYKEDVKKENIDVMSWW